MIKRITYRITDENPAHIRFHLWVNGGRINQEPICLRVEEFKPFIKLLNAISDSEWYEKTYGK